MNRSALILATAALLASTAPAGAGFVIQVGDLQLQTGGTGFLDVSIRSDATGGDRLNAFGFELRIETTGPARLEFVSPQPDPQLGSPNYVFAGNSLDGTLGLPVGRVLATSVPNDTFVGGDSTNTGEVTVTGNRLLARILVTGATRLAPRAGDTFTISVVSRAPTSNTLFLNDAGTVGFTTRSGTVTVASVPEPGSLVLLATGGLLAFAGMIRGPGAPGRGRSAAG